MYETVHPGVNLISLCLITGVERGKVYFVLLLSVTVFGQSVVLFQPNLGNSFDAMFLSLQKSLGTGMGGQSVEDLERVIAAMRRVVERLQGENDQLKKTVGSGGPQYGEVIKENKRVKVI